MKNLLISLLGIIMASNFCLAQNSHSNFELEKFSDLEGQSFNHDYLDKVKHSFWPNQVKYLENLVSHWDVTQSKKFDGRKGQSFSVTFKSESGLIVANYDSKGKIVSAMEQFGNFALPKSVSISIVRQYPNWEIVKNKYSLRYNVGNSTKKSFKVQIRKGNHKKWIKIHPSGSIG